MLQLKHSLPIILLLLATAFSVWIYFQEYQPAPVVPAAPETEATPQLKKPAKKHELTGISYSTTLDGNSLFTLQADSIELSKKKIGFLRIGLIHEALIRNGIINIYVPETTKNTVDKSSQNAKLITQEIRNSLLPPLPAKRIVTVVCSPATLIIHHNDKTETTISSPHATIDRKSNDIIFKGGAKAVSGTKNLIADKLFVSTKRRTISARDNVSVISPHGNSSMQQIRTDLHLNIQN